MHTTNIITDGMSLLTPRQAAALLQLDERTLTNWRSAGTGPRFLRINGRAIRYRTLDIESWLLDGNPSFVAQREAS